jgi:hypothetical protein
MSHLWTIKMYLVSKKLASFGVTGEQGVQMVMVTWCITLV